MKTDPKIEIERKKNLELCVKGLDMHDPRIKALYRIACEGHDYMNIDEGGVFSYTLIPADSSKFQNPGEGIVYFAVDDDYTKTDIKSVEYYSKLRIGEDGKGTLKDVIRTKSGRRSDYGFLPISFYDLIGSSEKIEKRDVMEMIRSKQEDRIAYTLFMQRTRTGIPKYRKEKGEDGRIMAVENNSCLALAFNGHAEREHFRLDQFTICTPIMDNVRFPLMLNSGKYGLVVVVDVKACLALYRDEFVKKNPGLADDYPKIELPGIPATR